LLQYNRIMVSGLAFAKKGRSNSVATSYPCDENVKCGTWCGSSHG